MGILERLGLVESVMPVEPVADYGYAPEPAPVNEVSAEVKSVDNVVNDIYLQNGLEDKSNSIFVVQALIDTLPAEMTTAKKQMTVAGILTVSGKSLGDLQNDASKRTGVLMAARDSVIDKRVAEINAAKADIEQLKQTIEAANIKIKEAEDMIEATKKSVNEEIGAIDALLEFCKGMEVQ